MAGSIYVLVNNFVNPDVFGLTLSLYILIGAVVGGLGSLWGVIVGAAFVQLLPIGLTSSSSLISPQAGAGDLRSHRDRRDGARAARCSAELLQRLLDSKSDPKRVIVLKLPPGMEAR